MRAAAVNKLKLGLYRVYWHALYGGGSSLAAVGITPDGRHWLAPVNWIAIDSEATPAHWRSVARVELVLDADTAAGRAAGWISPDQPPDADITVLARLNDDEYSIWPAYYDDSEDVGHEWRGADGGPLAGRVTAWMHLDAAAAALDGAEAVPAVCACGRRIVLGAVLGARECAVCSMRTVRRERALAAARDLDGLLRENVGDTADWPAAITTDNDETAAAIARALTELHLSIESLFKEG